ncbi:NADP-dependent oxidoreductase [Kibdelosporangium lantanae]
MLVIEVTQYGGPEVLHLAQRTAPQPEVGKVRVRVHATTVNPADLAIRSGVFAAVMPNLRFPFTLGWDMAGTVLDAGGGFTVGQRVVGVYPWLAEGTGHGPYAEVVLADPAWLAPLPEGVDWPTAATYPLAALTARGSVDLLAARAGDTVFVTGASGAVGGFAVQTAAQEGLHVIALAAPGDEDHVASLGAKQVITRGSAWPTDVDAMLDAAVTRDLSPVRPGGTFVAANPPSMPEAERGIEVTSMRWSADDPRLPDLLSLRTRVAEVYPIEKAAEAHARAARGGLRGKIVLTF